MLNACLAGPNVVGQRELIDRLVARHAVTCVADQSNLAGASILQNAAILVLDASGLGPKLEALLRTLRHDWPSVPIVLVDGGLSDDEKAEAFSIGVRDYFPVPCDVGLLVERLEVLLRCRDPQPADRGGENA